MAFQTHYFSLIFLLTVSQLQLVLLQEFEANIVAIFASESELQLNTEAVKAAVLLGVRQANRRYPNIKFNLKLKNDSRSCFENYAGVLAAEEYYRGKVTAFVGPACSKALDSVSRMASYWGIPTYTAGGVDTLFTRKNIFSTLTRLSFSLDQVCRFLLQIFMEFEWRHIVIIVDESEPSEVLLRNNFAMVMRETNYQLYLTYKAFNSKFDATYKPILKSASKDGRVFLLLACGEIVRKMLLAAYDLGMGNGDYVFLSIELLKSEISSKQFSWHKGNDDRNKEARKMYESVMVISVRVPVRPEYQIFITDVIELSKKEFSIDISPYSVNPMVSSFYDCVLLYAYSLNKTIFEGEDPSDGFVITRQIWNDTFFGGLTGDITINENGDREADYTLNDLDPKTGAMMPVAAYFGGRKIYDKIKGREIYWPENRGPPPDVPVCGFDGNAPECQTPYVFPLEGVILVSLAAVSILGCIIGFFVYNLQHQDTSMRICNPAKERLAITLRKILLESQLADMWWRIDWSDIELLDINHLGSSISFARSQYSQQSRSTPTKRSSEAESIFPSSTGIQVGSYNGVKVAIKYLRGINKIQISRNLLIELKLMRDMTHENLLRFVGLCITAPHFAVMTDFCARGRLSDMLYNEAINIDWIFSCSIITDIAEGMNFIHGSKLEYHGHLKSENCLIDGRFVVKLSNYGLKELRKQIPASETENAGSWLWTAPEHLRSKNPELQGSKKGDVYSFAILLQEIVTRRPPFEAPHREGSQPVYLTPEDIIERLQTATDPPYRPDIAENECKSDMLELIQMCWEEEPDARPSFSEIKHKLKRITKGMSSKSFLDNLLNRMEQYANNLESLVEEKTQSLVDEKKKTDELLYQMIPKYVADELKKGCHVKPEYFDSVTIFFSDIVGFTQLSAESTPLQVVDFLNDLYSCFDSIIENFNVYKVETIGDAYMVASGLPVRNGNEHAREIARLALRLLTELADFKIKHKPDRKLKLRIGIHSGPCVAGVVGLKMPRYCLFGDTVNTASRMESTSDALKIHISHQTKAILDLFKTFIIIPRGEIEVKGKGTMKTYWLESEMEKPTYR